MSPFLRRLAVFGQLPVDIDSGRPFVDPALFETAHTCDWLDQTDRLFAGWADAFTFGVTTKIRAWIYGDIATRNHGGVEFNVGWGTGLLHSVLLGYGAGGRTVTWGVQAARYYVMVGNMYAVGNSTYHLFDGSFRWYHTMGFVPLVGFLRNPAKAKMGIIFGHLQDDCHVMYGVEKNYAHAGGRSFRMYVVPVRNGLDGVVDFATTSGARTLRIPVLFPEAVVRTDIRAWFCFTAAAHAALRGWIHFI